MAEVKKTTAKTPAKVPQDRKPKAEPEKVFIPEETPGWHLLKPFSEVPVWDQGPIMAIVEDLSSRLHSGDGEGTEEVEIANTGDMLSIIGGLAKALRAVANDPDEYTRFVSGKDGLTNAANLGFAWARQLGESEASAS